MAASTTSPKKKPLGKDDVASPKPLKDRALSQSLKALNASVPNEVVSKTDLFTIDPRELVVVEGWNIRDAYDPNYYDKPDVQEYIRGLADSYINGDHVPAIVVVVKDGKAVVRDGHCRRRALLLAIAEGHAIEKVAVQQASGDETDHLALMLKSDDKLPVSLLGRADGYAQYVAWGWDLARIAKRVNRSYESVRKTLALRDLCLQLKHMIIDGKVAAYYVTDLVATHGEAKAIEMLEAGAGATNTGKITPRAVKKATGQALPRPTKKLVEAMRSSFVSLSSTLANAKIDDNNETFTIQLTREEYEALQLTAGKVKELQVPEAQSAEDNANNDDQQNLPLE